MPPLPTVERRSAYGTSVSSSLTLYLGIDPGVQGGLAVLSSNQEAPPIMETFGNVTEQQIWDMLQSRGLRPRGGVFAVIEKVGGYVRGSGGNVGHAMFRFGQSYGFLKGCLTAAAIPYDEVHSSTWQRAVGVNPKKGEGRPQRKRRLRQRAEQLFPGTRITNATADAMLLAYYCRQRHGERG